MAKFYGKIGYGVSSESETQPGVWTQGYTERDAVGEYLKNTRQLESHDKVNDDININSIISIVSDPYASQHFHLIKYAKDGRTGIAWKVINVEVQYPRLILTLGGVYNV